MNPDSKALNITTDISPSSTNDEKKDKHVLIYGEDNRTTGRQNNRPTPKSVLDHRSSVQSIYGAGSVLKNSVLRKTIVTELIEPRYFADVNDLLSEKNTCRKAGCSLEVISKIIIGSASIISFSAGFWNTPKLSFLSGACSVFGLVILHLASFFEKESKQRNEQLNIILEQLNIDPMPNIIQEINKEPV